ncbi:MAG TPA: histidine--tRNA ligase [Gammaproteobacteria bacterium]|jgi:histidyl-tRNA synthetase|nr:histidine--tRNA ligase [Gammaproteobacteria bacterium]
MSDQIKSVRGMPAILPGEVKKWQFVEAVAKNVLHAYSYNEIRTPVVERSELFQRTIGENTDIVAKEMYTFIDRNDQSLSLRPEATAGIIRAGIDQGFFYNQTQKLWSIGPMYRYERPQKGRYRQFHQINMEAFGFPGPDIDFEMILLTGRIWKALNLSPLQLELNSLGSPESRKEYKRQLQDYFNDHQKELDEDSLRRLERNPLRILDSKNPDLQEIIESAPKMVDFLDQESNEHFEELMAMLQDHAIEYSLNTRLVRGLDYYTRTVFEWTTDQLGAQATVCGGGRYDALVAELGGKSTSAIGCAIGLERLIELVDVSGQNEQNNTPKIYIVAVGSKAEGERFLLAEELRDVYPNLSIEMNLNGGQFKQQFKRADKAGADIALILGDDEISKQTVGVKPMRSEGHQETVDRKELLSIIDQFL